MIYVFFWETISLVRRLPVRWKRNVSCLRHNKFLRDQRVSNGFHAVLKKEKTCWFSNILCLNLLVLVQPASIIFLRNSYQAFASTTYSFKNEIFSSWPPKKTRVIADSARSVLMLWIELLCKKPLIISQHVRTVMTKYLVLYLLKKCHDKEKHSKSVSGV